MEMKMKAIIASVAAVAALAAAMPAAAQSWGGSFNGRDNGRFDNRSDQRFDGRFDNRGRSEAARIEQRIEVGLRNGSLTRNEAIRIRADLRVVQQLEWRFTRDGRVTPNEARELDRRYAQVAFRLRAERNDRDYDRRGYGSGYGNGRY